MTQADAARKWGVDVSVVIRIRRLAKDAALAAIARGFCGEPADGESSNRVDAAAEATKRRCSSRADERKA